MSQRILMIEGDPVLRDSMWRLLSDHGHQVELAANGAQAAERSLSARFDTLILDVSRIDIGAGFLTRLLGEDGAHGPAPSLIGLVEHRHWLAVSRVCGGVFKAILSKPLRSGALLDAISGAGNRPAAMGAGLPPQGERRNRPESTPSARDLSTTHWRRCGLQTRPRVFACPKPRLDQEKALKLCFDMANPQDADLIILLERHGMSEAKRLASSADKMHRPIIALSRDHADLCEAVFEITSETSWRKIASFVRRGRTPSGLVPQVEAALAASAGAAGVMPQTHENDGDEIAPPLKAPIRDREGPLRGWNNDAKMHTGAQVLLIEGAENRHPGLTLALARAGHIVCRVQDAHASTLAAARTQFDVGVIDMKRNCEPHSDLAGLVRSLRGAQRGMPIILVGSELSGKDRDVLAGAGGISFLAKAGAQENLVEAVSAAISYGGHQSLASGGH